MFKEEYGEMGLEDYNIESQNPKPTMKKKLAVNEKKVPEKVKVEEGKTITTKEI